MNKETLWVAVNKRVINRMKTRKTDGLSQLRLGRRIAPSSKVANRETASPKTVMAGRKKRSLRGREQSIGGWIRGLVPRGERNVLLPVFFKLKMISTTGI